MVTLLQHNTKRPFYDPLLFITSNQLKLDELVAIIPYIQGVSLEIPEIQTLDMDLLVREKARAAYAVCKQPCIVEDTALYLDCLRTSNNMHGLPGPLIKWFLITLGNSGIADLAMQLGNMSAQARTVIGYAQSADEIHLFDAVVEGFIIKPDQYLTQGWSAIFVPSGYDKPLDAFTMQEKNVGLGNMRSIAAHKLNDFLSA